MDTTAEEITFDENGVCSFCHEAQRQIKTARNKPLVMSPKKGKYDAIIGLSGGADSSYLLHVATKMGWRLLAFHIDNGYNDPRADENVLKMVEKLKVPFYRYTIDLKKFKELQSAFLHAGVRNIEIPTDHILFSACYEMAAQYGIKYVLSGGNVNTESIMPASWGYMARDLKHIKAIYKKFTGKRLKGLPTCGILKFNYYKWIKKIETIYLLDYVEYNREKAIELLTKEYGFQSTGEKHEESVFTKWFQNFYLFEKFGIDKRKAHYSSLINSGQMTREEAMNKLTENPVYPALGIEGKVLKYPKHSHFDYPTNLKLYNFISRIVKLLQ